MVRIKPLDMSTNGFGPCGNLDESSLAAAGEERNDTAHVAILPGHDRRIVTVANAVIVFT